MADTDTNETPQQQFAIQRIYIKDLSFEAPQAPAVFLEKVEPQVSIDLNTQANQINEGVFEVVLTVTATAKSEDKALYVAEVKQAGIFSVVGFDDAERGQLLGSYCPNVLFPYVREAISDMVARGTFPPVFLTPINFDALYAQHLQQQQAAGEDEQKPVH